MKNKWSVYLVECNDNSIYCGITTNVERRVEQHNKGRGGAYTRSRKPVKLVAHHGNLTHTEALKIEASIKGFPRKAKLHILATFDQWVDQLKINLENRGN